ncbi:carboxypeptidase S [Jaminaea rosea]|uniref:Carboxypeptidase S n=1 Tax=Jaminaea rosea TaxID=1569628 RepID=A0A316USZ9_9BASI|nr:carboxypeptidase S [Jaminaea rosea]PWN27918.1 carboxypeptidase S [Jaminaea rosea]
MIDGSGPRTWSSPAVSAPSTAASGPSALAVCKQYPSWSPPSQSNFSLPAPLPASTYAKLLSGAVRIDTTVPDSWGPLNAPNVSSTVRENYRKAFAPFEAYLSRSFPLVHSVLTKEVVDSHGLIFTWRGSDESLKPLVLMAHQDVVPVEPSTVGQWVHDPFSGSVDEENGVVWGRGSSDDKASLISIMSALESLASSTFKPSRTIVASFGFDEESTGSAAAALASFLVERYVPTVGGAELIVDEGGEVLGADVSEEEGGMGTAYAGPATSEKGYLDVRVTVRTPGGHSSVPPRRTGIGHLARLVASIEDNAPQPRISDVDHPALAPLLCLREAPAIKEGRPQLYKTLQHLVKQLEDEEKPRARIGCPGARRRRDQQRRRELLNSILPQLSAEEQALFGTTQAVDLISGGVKINALPEKSEAVVNYRIDVRSSVGEVKEWVGKVVQKKAKELGLDFIGWTHEEVEALEAAKSAKGTVSLSVAFNSALEPTPSSPIVDGTESSAAAWRLLSSVIRSTWRDHGEIPVIPTLMGGNTDTKSYHALSRNIFRFSGGTLNPPPKGMKGADGGIHTVNEYASIDALVKGTEFYSKLIWAVQVIG